MTPQEQNYWDDEDEALGDAFAVHPGLILKNSILPDRRISAAALADKIGVARPGLNRMLNGKRSLTSEMAVLIGAAIDYPADPLVLMMASHDLARTRARADLVDRIARMALVRGQDIANDDDRIRMTG